MSKVVQHVPGCVDIDPEDIERAEFNTQEELLAIPWIARWAEKKNFHRFSISKSKIDNHLMAELDEGRVWWVVGYLSDREHLSLPIWKPVYE
jgi:hypothetical protein